jgi:hypothetical protein
VCAQAGGSRYLTPNFQLYLRERPEMTSHEEKSKKAKHVKEKLVGAVANLGAIPYTFPKSGPRNDKRGVDLIPLCRSVGCGTTGRMRPAMPLITRNSTAVHMMP